MDLILRPPPMFRIHLLALLEDYNKGDPNVRSLLQKAGRSRVKPGATDPMIAARSGPRR